MKTTFEIPDPLFRKAKAAAAEGGQSLQDFFTDALRDKLAPRTPEGLAAQPAWMHGFGKLKRLRHETARIQAAIDIEFGAVERRPR